MNMQYSRDIVQSYILKGEQSKAMDYLNKILGRSAPIAFDNEARRLKRIHQNGGTL